MKSKLCDLNIKTGYRGEIMCDEGYAKYEVKISKNNELIDTKYICRFCLDRYVSDTTDKGYEVQFTKLEGKNV